MAAIALALPIEENIFGRGDCNCLPIAKCPPLLKLAEERKFDRLREHHRCGFEKREALLCCPTENIGKGARRNINTRKLTEGIENNTTEVNQVHVEVHEEENVSKEESINKICMKDIHDLEAVERYQCGTPEVADRITGGEDADSHEWPWAAAIAYNPLEPDYRCGGSLIHEQYVMTAAHCVVDQSGNLVDNLAHVFLGHANLHDPCGIKVKIEKAIAHPDYSSPLPTNDIALLKLVRPVKTGPTINTLCLPSPDEDIEDIEEPFVVGWGYTDAVSNHSVLPSILQELELRVVPVANCTRIYRKVLQDYESYESLATTFAILESQICAEGLSFGKDSCRGDSGGPVVSLNSDFQYVARGVVSYGGPTCDSEYPGVYTRVSRYLGWIDSVINNQ